MPPIPQGYTNIQDAPQKWLRRIAWWYEEVREGRLTGYSLPGIRGTYLKDSEVETYINTMQPKSKGETAS